MQVVVCKDYDAMSREAARLVAESVRENPKGLLSFPGGDTPKGMVQEFVRMVNDRELDISAARYVSLDEWVGLSNTDIGSCGLFNRENLLMPLQHPFAQVHLIDGAAEIESERAALDAVIANWGPLEVSVLGIGMNGHLGFNEEGVDFGLHAHITPLSDTTKRVMTKYFGKAFSPVNGITQGIGQIMQAKKVVLIANGAHKADIISRAVHGPVTNLLPASALQRHPNCFVVVDEAAGANL